MEEGACHSLVCHDVAAVRSFVADRPFRTVISVSVLGGLGSRQRGFRATFGLSRVRTHQLTRVQPVREQDAESLLVKCE